MSVKLRKRPNADGSISLVLDIYNKGKREYQFLRDLKLPAVKSPADRQKRKEYLETAHRIERDLATKLSENAYDLPNKHSKMVSVLVWFKDYSKTYGKKDYRVINAVVNKFTTFLTEKKLTGLQMKDFTETIVEQFLEKLESECKGEGARSYYSRFRKMVRQAYKEKLLVRNPCEFVSPPSGQAAEKDILTFQELQLVAQTETDAGEVKKAFIFSSITGLRWCDIKALTWGQVNLPEHKMTVVQSKTNKIVVIPLNATALQLLGTEQPKTQLVFTLPTANGCNKSLNLLVRRAGIDKNITWHCGRHFLGNELIRNGTDVHTVSKLLGHTGITHTMRYTRVNDELNKKAVDSLPEINL